jgi:hypothetical protein
MLIIRLGNLIKKNMKYITIDGDDVGQRVASSYLKNDLNELSRINQLVREKTGLIAEFLRSHDFTVIFCAADGVAGYAVAPAISDEFIFESIKSLVGSELTFSVGVGDSLRESYIALLSAKSSGKARIHNYLNMK